MAPVVHRATSVLGRLDAARITREILKGIPAGLVISLNAWAVSAWLKATILINSQPRWLFRKKRWSEGEMRAISCYYLVIAYLMLRVVRLTSTLTKRPGRPYGDFFRNTRPILGKVALFSIATMMVDEFVMFYILRKFGLEKRRILITGRPLEKDTEFTDDDCCICYGAMLDDDEDVNITDHDEYYSQGGQKHHHSGLNRDTDHVLENFCVEKQHVAHRGCIRKWYNYGPKGYRPMEAFRIVTWGTALHGAVAGMNANLAGPHGMMANRVGLGWLLSLPNLRPNGDAITRARRTNEIQLRVPLDPDNTTRVLPEMTIQTEATTTTTQTQDTQHLHTHESEQEPRPQQHEQEQSQQTATVTTDPTADPTALESQTTTHEHQEQQTEEHEVVVAESTDPADVAEPVLRPLFPTTGQQQQDDYNASSGRNAGRKTCPACRQNLVLNFVDLAKGRREMSFVQKLLALGRDMTKFSDWRGLILRSLITAGWVGVTIVGGKLRIVAMDKAMAKHQKNRALASLTAAAVNA
ncbi:hypothetical protein EMPS_04506 [Entomortierella parvispora]|uniref:Uncharacterized protein n=1 Tax=Entomortierella parvispora TaxID=205924 RepID=A0A9P3H8M3_9FUNG|nr:hypothetical protein EMPS_04506 [Entomortierella parvispora]